MSHKNEKHLLTSVNSLSYGTIQWMSDPKRRWETHINFVAKPTKAVIIIIIIIIVNNACIFGIYNLPNEWSSFHFYLNTDYNFALLTSRAIYF